MKTTYVIAISIAMIAYVFAMPRNVIFAYLQSNNQINEKCSSGTNNVKFCVASDKITVKSGEEINLKLLVKNRGNKDVIISNQFPLEFEVFNEKGKIAPILSEQNKDNPKGFINRISVSHRYGITLKPQQDWETNVKLSEKYNLSKQGKYFVLIKAKLPDKNTIIELNLDKIEINVR